MRRKHIAMMLVILAGLTACDVSDDYTRLPDGTYLHNGEFYAPEQGDEWWMICPPNHAMDYYTLPDGREINSCKELSDE